MKKAINKLTAGVAVFSFVGFVVLAVVSVMLEYSGTAAVFMGVLFASVIINYLTDDED